MRVAMDGTGEERSTPQDLEALKRLLRWTIFGAPERNNLEPFDSDQLLLELENWADILKAEPEVIHRLAVLAETQDEDVGDAPIVAPSPPELGL